MDKIQLRDALSVPTFTAKQKLMFCLYFDSCTPKKPIEIRRLASDNGLKEVNAWNISDTLSKAKGLVVSLRAGWALTSKGETEVRSLLPAAVTSAPMIANIRASLSAISSPAAKLFIEEAVSAYEHKLFRSAVVLSWVGAVSILYHHVHSKHLVAFNAEALGKDPTWKPAKSLDDLALMNEAKFLDHLAAISVLGKNVKEFLKSTCLALRNSCGHPNSFVVGPAQVESHLEHLALNIYSKF